MKIKDLSKRILAFMLMTMLLIGSFPVNVSADTVSETPISYFKYTKLRGNSKDSYVGVRIDGFEYKKSEKNLVIPNEIEGLPVVEIKTSAFRKSNIDSLVLNKNLEKIGSSAFADNNIDSLVMEDRVETIGASAFYDNKLSEIRLPESVKIIGASSFKVNPIKEFDIAKMAPGVQEIGKYAFGVHYAKDSVLEKLVINDEWLDLCNGMSSKKCGDMKDVLYRQTPKSIVIETTKLENLDKKIFTSLISSAVVDQVKDVVISDSVKVLGQGTFDKFGYKNIGEENEVVFTVLNPNMEFEIGCRGSLHYEKKYTPFAWLDRNNVVLVSYNDSTSREFVEYFDGLLPEEKLGKCIREKGDLKDRLEFRGILDISRTIDGKDIERTDIKVNDEFSYNVKMSLGGFLEGTSVELVEEFHELFNLKDIEVRGITDYTETILGDEKAVIEIPVNDNTMDKDIEVIFTGSLSMPKDEKPLDIVSKSELRGSKININSNETVIRDLITDINDTSYQVTVLIDSEKYAEYTIPGKIGPENIPNYLEDINKIQNDVEYKEIMIHPDVNIELVLTTRANGGELKINPEDNKVTLSYIAVKRYGIGVVRHLDENGRDIADRDVVFGGIAEFEQKTVYAKEIDGYKLAAGEESEGRIGLALDTISTYDFLYVKADKTDSLVADPVVEEVAEVEEVIEEDIVEEVDELEEMEEEVSEAEIVEPEENDPSIFKTYNISKDEIKILGFARGKAVRDLVIPEEIDGKTVTEISRSAFKNENLDSLVLPNSIKKIHKYAFAYNNLQAVEIPENTEVISSYAFMSNLGLEAFSLDNAAYVSPYAFIYNK